MSLCHDITAVKNENVMLLRIEVSMKVKRLIISFGALLVGTIILALVVRFWLNSCGYDPSKMNSNLSHIEIIMK